MLDATKAFDEVDFVKLFALLMKCDIPGIFLRLIMDLCTRQTIKTAWNGVLFSKFYGSVNGLCVRFNGVLYNPGVTTKLFCAHCCSFYGSQEYASIYEII